MTDENNAQVASQTSEPRPGLRSLDKLVGTWRVSGPDIEGYVTYEWMEGGFFLVCHVDFKGVVGSGTGITVMGYSVGEKAYSYREFNSWGEFTDSKGSLDGDTWTWSNDEKMGGTPMKGRFIMKVTSPTSYGFSYEMSGDGAKWTMVMDGKATKVK